MIIKQVKQRRKKFTPIPIQNLLSPFKTEKKKKTSSYFHDTLLQMTFHSNTKTLNFNTKNDLKGPFPPTVLIVNI